MLPAVPKHVIASMPNSKPPVTSARRRPSWIVDAQRLRFCFCLDRGCVPNASLFGSEQAGDAQDRSGQPRTAGCVNDCSMAPPIHDAFRNAARDSCRAKTSRQTFRGTTVHKRRAGPDEEAHPRSLQRMRRLIQNREFLKKFSRRAFGKPLVFGPSVCCTKRHLTPLKTAFVFKGAPIPGDDFGIVSSALLNEPRQLPHWPQPRCARRAVFVNGSFRPPKLRCRDPATHFQKLDLKPPPPYNGAVRCRFAIGAGPSGPSDLGALEATSDFLRPQRLKPRPLQGDFGVGVGG